MAHLLLMFTVVAAAVAIVTCEQCSQGAMFAQLHHQNQEFQPELGQNVQTQHRRCCDNEPPIFNLSVQYSVMS